MTERRMAGFRLLPSTVCNSVGGLGKDKSGKNSLNKETQPSGLEQVPLRCTLHVESCYLQLLCASEATDQNGPFKWQNTVNTDLRLEVCGRPHIRALGGQP